MTGGLPIRFGRGERPYLFWVSSWVAGPGPRVRFKILSKSDPQAGVEVWVFEERRPGRRRLRARELLPSEPSGWLAHWVDELAVDLDVKFHCFDLSAIETESEFLDAAERLGWFR